MPRYDGTGPVGYGPMTGRRRGYCAGYPTPGYANRGVGPGMPGRGRGLGRGYYGRGRGFGPGWGAPAYMRRAVMDDADSLAEEADFLKNEVKAIEERLAEMEESLKGLSKPRPSDKECEE